MKTSYSTRPRFLIYLFRVYAVLGIVPFLANTADILLHPITPSASVGERLLMGLVAAPLTLAIAVLCIRRAPGNLIGWMLVAFAYGISVQVARVDLLPLEVGIIVYSQVISMFWSAFLLIPLYFPDGQLYPARANRWGNRLVGFQFLLVGILATIFNAEYSWNSGSRVLTVPNPLFVSHWDYSVVTVPIGVAIIAAGIVMIVLRYRSGGELQRLQIRWLLFGVFIQAVLTMLIFWKPVGYEGISKPIILLYNLIIPLAIGIAVLRYRLYDIEVIIRRTLQYGLLSVLLGLVYLGMVILLQQAFRAFTGQASPVAVVISTLVIAGLFNPLRRRIQAVIDQRFFRAKYDADRAVASFSAAARSLVDLDSLARQLAITAEESLQPQGVWVWIRKEARRDG